MTDAMDMTAEAREMMIVGAGKQLVVPCLTYFSPGEVSALTGVAPETIRTWRARGFLPPTRGDWTPVDVARLLVLSLTAEVTHLSFAAHAAERACRTVVYLALMDFSQTVEVRATEETAAEIVRIFDGNPSSWVLHAMLDDAPEETEPFMFQNRDTFEGQTGGEIYWDFADSLKALDDCTDMPVRLVMNLHSLAKKLRDAVKEPLLVIQLAFLHEVPEEERKVIPIGRPEDDPYPS